MPSTKNREYVLSVELLAQYRDCAVANAEDLLAEAALLLQHEHHARAYFLAVAAVEEVGKAVQAFDGMGRNLANPAVCTKLKAQFQSHSQKVTSAFVPWLLASPNLREEVMSFVNTMIDVKHGREPSMYTDIQVAGPTVVAPRSMVRPAAAENCVRLAHAVLAHAKPHVSRSAPKVTTQVQDEFFAMNQTTFLKMSNTADFWEYYITRMEAGEMALEDAVTSYHVEYYSKGLKFRTEGE